MATRNDTSNGSAMLAFTLGSLIGMAAGLLFAPKSGQESREQLKQKVLTAKNKLQEQAVTAKEATQTKVDQTLDTVQESTQIVEEAAERLDGQAKKHNRLVA